MRERAVAIDERAADAQIRTFHSFGSWFLRKYAEHAGLEPSFTVYDEDDMATLIKKAEPSLSNLINTMNWVMLLFQVTEA